MSSFLLGFIKLQELFNKNIYTIEDKKQCLIALIDLTFAREANPFYASDALEIRQMLPFSELSIRVERLIYTTYLQYLRLNS